MPNPGLSTEDGRIMYERARLERVWATLSSGQQTAWLNRWTTDPPLDIAGRVYITTTPTAFGQVLVSPATAYAWSQIYATYRFGLDELDEPDDSDAPELSLDSLVASTNELTIALSSNLDPLPDQRILVYATAPHYSTLRQPQYRLRPIGFYTGANMPASADLFDAYAFRWTPIIGLSVAVRAAIIGPNNEHVISEQYLSEMVSA